MADCKYGCYHHYRCNGCGVATCEALLSQIADGDLRRFCEPCRAPAQVAERAAHNEFDVIFADRVIATFEALEDDLPLGDAQIDWDHEYRRAVHGAARQVAFAARRQERDPQVAPVTGYQIALQHAHAEWERAGKSEWERAGRPVLDRASANGRVVTRGNGRYRKTA